MSTETEQTEIEIEITTTIDIYLAGLHEQDPTVRAKLIEQAWAPDARYLDPLQDERGYAGLNEIAPRVEQHYPGHAFRRTSAVDAHHDRVRFCWELVAPDGAVVVAGIDVGELAPDGRLQSIVGFFGDL